MKNTPFSKIEQLLKTINNEKETVSNDTAPTLDIHKCDFCKRKALYDGKTKSGMWAAMCEEHFKENGVGLGLGLGQKLIRPEEI